MPIYRRNTSNSAHWLYVENNGLGPAKITSIGASVYDTDYDLSDHREAFACGVKLFNGKPIPDTVHYGSIAVGGQIVAGDRLDIYRSAETEPEPLIAAATRLLQLRVTYESLYGKKQQPLSWGPAAFGTTASLEEILRR